MKPIEEMTLEELEARYADVRRELDGIRVMLKDARRNNPQITVSPFVAKEVDRLIVERDWLKLEIDVARLRRDKEGTS